MFHNGARIHFALAHTMSGFEQLRDGSRICQADRTGKWAAWWSDGVPLRGVPDDGEDEVDWLFESRAEAVEAILAAVAEVG